MPELPDVEGYRRTLEKHGTGHRIQQVEVLDPGVLHGTDPTELAATLAGQQLRRPDRHGKWLLAHTDGPTVLLHFGMTGELRWAVANEPRHRHDRIVFRLDDGQAELRYRDMRKLQGLRLARGAGEIEQELAELGPDALVIERDEFLAVLAGRRGAIKPALIDQSRIAGLGNLLADEILWRARVHPAAPVPQLTEGQRRRLYEQLRRVLARAVPAGRVPPLPSWLTGVRDDPTGRCPRCGADLARTTVGGRRTVWCPHCQPPA